MVEATRAGQEALDVRALETAFDEGSEPSAEFVVGYALAVTSTHMARWLPEAIGVTLAAGGNAEARTAREANVFRTAQGFEDLYFDQTNREAVLWAGERSSTLITQITAKTRTAIRATIARSFVEGIPTDQAARMLRSLIGLTPRQAGAAMTLRSKILAKPGKKLWAGRMPIRVPKAGATIEWLERRVGQYSSRLLNLRARTIARTETIAASNEGQRQLWGQAQGKGLLAKNQLKEWIITPDDRLCAVCEPLNGSTALVNEQFPDIGVQGPPAHPACRCAMGISSKFDRASDVGLPSGSPERPEWSGVLNAQPSVKPRDVRKVQNALDALPVQITESIKNYEFSLVTAPITGHVNASGVTFYQENRIAIRAIRTRKTIQEIVRHETAHVFDRAQGISRQVKDAWLQDMKSFGKRPGDRLVQHYALNEREGVAQSITHLTGRILDVPEFRKAFPKTIDAVRSVLEGMEML